MPVRMSGNFIFAGPDQKAFKVASNFTNYIELGTPAPDPDYYLEARIEEDQFLLSATLWEPHTDSRLRIIDNFPDGPPWSRKMLRNGWHIVDPKDRLILGIEVTGNICHLKGRIVNRDGSVIAEESGDDFLVHRGPAVLGRSGSTRGIVLG
jgi:hypothetical protein